MYLYFKRWTSQNTTGWFKKQTHTTHHLRVRLELTEDERNGLEHTSVHATSAVVLNSEDAIWTLELIDKPYVDLEHHSLTKIQNFEEQLRETGLYLKQALDRVMSTDVPYEEIVED